MSILDWLREPYNEQAVQAKRETEAAAEVPVPSGAPAPGETGAPASPSAPAPGAPPVPPPVPPPSPPTGTPPPGSPTTPPPAEEPKRPSEVVFSAALKALGALAGVFTLTGFVTLVGGAVYWTRFEAVGIPYDQAVAVIDPAQLIVVGASALVVFGVSAIFALIFLFAADTSGYVGRGTATGLLVLFIAAGLYAFAGLNELNVWKQLILTVVAGILAIACLTVAENHSLKFVPFAVAVLAAVLIWGGLVGFLSAQALDQVQAAAVVGGKDVRSARGFYVTDTDETIYLARVVPNRVAGGREDFDDQGLFEIDRKDDGTRLAIGPLQDEEIARKESKFLLRKLKAQSAKQGKLVAKAKKEAKEEAEAQSGED